jgi:hypothetical protein
MRRWSTWGGASLAATIEACEAIAALFSLQNLPLGILIVEIIEGALAGLIVFLKRKVG